MKFGVLALDYDGTIAHEGALDQGVRRAIANARARGVTTILVTGRILADLKRAAGDLDFVDVIVAENGGVFTMTGERGATALGDPPPEAFTTELRRRGVNFRAGACVVEADAGAADRLLTAIRTLELPLVLVFNRGRVMVLPRAVTKATGLQTALRALRLSPHNAIAIGDAENDHELLRICEVGVAVAWGSPALQAIADDRLDGVGPPDVARYIDHITTRRTLPKPRFSRRRFPLGYADDGGPIEVELRPRNLALVGTDEGTKRQIVDLLCEQAILHGYSVVVIDTGGAHRTLETLPGVIVLGGDDVLPAPWSLVEALRHPDVNVIVDVSRAPRHERLEYVRAVLPTLTLLRRDRGLPHRVVLEDADEFLEGLDIGRCLDLELAGHVFVAKAMSGLPLELQTTVDALLTTHGPDTIEGPTAWFTHSVSERRAQLRVELSPGEVVLWSRDQAADARSVRITPAGRTVRVRPDVPYPDIAVPESRAFVVTRRGTPTGIQAHTPLELARAIDNADAESLEGHIRRGDLSYWIATAVGDSRLASEVRQLEFASKEPSRLDVRASLVRSIRTRYEAAAHDQLPGGSPHAISGS